MASRKEILDSARSNGYLLYAMNQMETAGAKECVGGYCVGLATVWIRKLWDLTDYPYDPATREYKGTNLLAVDIQKTYNYYAARDEDAFGPVRKGFAKAGLKLNVGRSQWTDYGISSSGLYGILEKGKSANYTADGTWLIGMKEKGGTASHAMGILNGASQIWCLFDANYGHFRVQGDDAFYAFLTKYLSSGGTNYINAFSGGWMNANATRL